MKRASDKYGIDCIFDALDSFRCFWDQDIELFLRKKAGAFIQRNWCSVYLIVDEQKFEEGNLKINAYFTLSHKALIPSKVSKSTLKDASGFKTAEAVHFVLIGQLGKYIEHLDGERYKTADISSAEILEHAFRIAREANRMIPCRCALVECSDNEKVHKVYQDYGFKFFQFDGDHYQFYRRI